jgi:hypothetical protein
MATRNDIILKLASLFSNEIDGDLILLIDQNLDNALNDTVGFLIDARDDRAEKFRKQVVDQTWASNEISIPADLLLHNQKKTVVLSITTTGVKYPVFQVDDWRKLMMIPTATLDNHYAVLENGKFLIREKTGSTGGSNLNINYYRTPVIGDITTEIEPLLLNFLLKYIGLKQEDRK